MFGDFGEVKLEVDEAVLGEEVDLGVVFLVEFLETVNRLGYLELVQLEELNCLVFLLSDQFSLSDDILFMGQELLKGLRGLFEDLLCVVLDFDLDGFYRFLEVFGLGLVLLFAHGCELTR